MKKAILGAAIAAIASTGAFAEDYQFEIGAEYVTGDVSDTDVDGFGFFGFCWFLVCTLNLNLQRPRRFKSWCK